MSTALATLSEKHNTLTTQLNNARDRIAQVIPLGLGLAPSRAIAVVIDACARNPALLECTPQSIVRCVIAASEVGLELGSPLGDSYIVPFKNHKKQRTDATFMIGYRGYIRLIRGAPRVTIIKGVLVREADEFDQDEGAQALVHRVPRMTERERGEITHAYARVWYEGGSSQFEVMDRDALDKIRRMSKDTRGDAPWNQHRDEMYKKCPIRRMAKWLDLSQQARRAAELDSFESMVRGEFGGETREGFVTGRADEMKDMIAAQGKPAVVIDAEIEE